MNKESGLRTAIVSGIFFLPFVSLIVFGSLYFPYITGKNIVFRVIVLIIAALYAWLLYKDKDFAPTFGALAWSFTAFVLILFIANIFGIYPHKSFFSNFERMEGFFTILLLFFYFIVLSGVMRSEKTWERLLNTILSAGVIMAVFALAEQSEGVTRVSAQLGNSTYLGAYMLFNMFIAFFMLIRYFQRINLEPASRYTAIVTYGVIILLDFYVFYNTGTRGALLGIFAGTVFISVLFAFFQKENKKLKFAGMGILALIIISVGLLYSFRNAPAVQNNPLLSRFAALVAAPTDISTYVETQGKGRLGIWSIALEGVKERPILGWGQDNFNYVFNKNYDPKMYDQEQWFDRAHNVFFDWMVAGGILGLLSYLSLFGFAFYVLWRKKREDTDHHFSFADKTILSALLIAYFIHNLFVFDSLTSYILFFTILAFISFHEKSAGLVEKLKAGIFDFLKDSKTQAALSGGFIIASMIGIYYLAILPWISASSLIDALTYNNTVFASAVPPRSAQQESLLENELNAFKSAIDSGIVGRSEAREQLLQSASMIVPSNNFSTSTRQSYDQEAQGQMKAQMEETPEDVRYILFYASYLNRTGRQEESFPYFVRANELSPNKQSILHDQGTAYINADRFNEALEIYRRAYELEPSNQEALSYYIMALIYAGENAKADELRAPIRETAQGTHIRIIKAYNDTNQREKVSLILSDKLGYANKIYAEGNRDEAIRIMREVISINPQFAATGQAIIEKMQRGEQ
jgi:O-antigen ligase